MKRILTVAGSDSGGGAGIQADLKAITVLGGYGMTVVTALTAQNTVGVQGVHAVPVDFIARQMESVLSDIGADAAKTGMLATSEIVEVVADGIKKYNIQPLVVDPVMVAKSGDSLLAENARQTLKTALLPLATVVTPNLPEAEVLCGCTVKRIEEMQEAARRIHDLGPRYVVVKGGHMEGRPVDLLFDGQDFQTFDAPRLKQRNTHGTGCTFSAALATILAENIPIAEAVGKAKEFITQAISMGLDIGAGHGPTNPYAHILNLKERETVPAELSKALDFLVRQRLGSLIPEVRSNLGYALSGAAGYQDFSPQILEACKTLGLHMTSFDRQKEPKEVKEREGSTLEWGTSQALQGVEEIPDLVYDKGDVGKEPMIRILGKNPMEVVEKINRIKQNLTNYL